MQARGPVVLELARWAGPRERVLLHPGVAEVGPAEGPFALHAYPSPALADDLSYFRRTFAPARFRTGPGAGAELTFRGEGSTSLGPVERRLLLEWARAAASSLDAGANERSFGLVFSWHGEGGAAPCDEVSAFLNGTVWAEACPWGGEVRARREPPAHARLYAWYDGLAPFQVAPGEGTGSPESERAPRLIFAGSGKRAATAAEREEVQAFGEELSRELRVRRPLPAGVAPAEPVVSALLLPPELSGGGRPTDVVLELPAQPPPKSTPSDGRSTGG